MKYLVQIPLFVSALGPTSRPESPQQQIEMKIEAESAHHCVHKIQTALLNLLTDAQRQASADAAKAT